MLRPVQLPARSVLRDRILRQVRHNARHVVRVRFPIPIRADAQAARQVRTLLRVMLLVRHVRRDPIPRLMPPPAHRVLRVRLSLQPVSLLARTAVRVTTRRRARQVARSVRRVRNPPVHQIRRVLRVIRGTTPLRAPRPVRHVRRVHIPVTVRHTAV